jgi:regulator of RNase E activity RraA
MTVPDGADVLSWIRANLYVPVVCDILDSLGYRDQAMHQRLRPLDVDCCTIVGWARTIRWMAVDHVDAGDPYGLEIDATDALRPGDVVVHSTDYTGTIVPWGELMTTAAVQRGAVGCVCDCMIRDCQRIRAMRFPVFHAGIRPLDSKGRGRVMAYDVPVRCGEVLVHPGDLIFADFDGVVAVQASVVPQALEAAAEKVGMENVTRQELLAGRTLRDVYNQYGVL